MYAQRSNILAFPPKYPVTAAAQSPVQDNNRIAQLEHLAERAQSIAEQAGMLVRSLEKMVTALDTARLALDRITIDQPH